jgi:raffinose/stachyose/melibiose transport system substrate-binding protein
MKEVCDMKRFLIVALGLLLLVAFSASAQKTTLNFLYYADATQAGYAEDMDFWQQFQDNNPDIDLQMEILFSQAYHQKLAAYIAAGQLPDVMYMWPTSRDSSMLLHDQKLVKDLKPLLGADFLSNFVAPALDVNQQSSKQLSELPQSFTYTTVMYTNKKLLADNKIALPKTYADLKAMVTKLKIKGVQTLLLPDGDQWPAQSCLFSTISGRLLGDSWTDQVKQGKVKFTDTAYVNALTFYKTLYTDGVINWQNVQMGYGDGPGLFATGKAAFFIDGDWRQGAYLTDKTTGKALIDPAQQATDFAFLNFPAIPGEKYPGVVSAIAGVGLGISSAIPTGSAKEQAAVKLLKWYYGPEMSTMKLETGAFIPTRKGVTSEKLEPFTMMMPKYYQSIAKTCYVIDGVLDPTVFNVLNAGLQALGLGAKEPKTVAAEMQAKMDEWLKAQKK